MFCYAMYIYIIVLQEVKIVPLCTLDMTSFTHIVHISSKYGLATDTGVPTSERGVCGMIQLLLCCGNCSVIFIWNLDDVWVILLMIVR